MMYFTYRDVKGLDWWSCSHFIWTGEGVNFQYWILTPNVMIYSTYRDLKAKIDEIAYIYLKIDKPPSRPLPSIAVEIKGKPFCHS